VPVEGRVTEKVVEVEVPGRPGGGGPAHHAPPPMPKPVPTGGVARLQQQRGGQGTRNGGLRCVFLAGV